MLLVVEPHAVRAIPVGFDSDEGDKN